MGHVRVMKCMTEVLEEPPFLHSEGCLLLASLATNEMTIIITHTKLPQYQVTLKNQQNHENNTNISNCPLAIECWPLEDVAQKMHELPP